MRIGSLFSGYGGLEQGVQSVLGGSTAWVSDIDPGACKILAHRYPDVPNLGDISAVDWSAVEPVDVLTGGFPCQDVSAAGKRAGIKPGTRSGLWSEMHRAIIALRPSLVVIENVRGLLSATAQHPAHSDVEPCPWCVGDDEPVSLRALGAVLGDLADAGFDASWQGLRAADVGAPHGRFRVFVVAWDASGAARRGAKLQHLRTRLVAAAEPGGPASPTPPHPDRLGHERGWRARDGRPGSADGAVTAADAGREHGRGGRKGLRPGANSVDRSAPARGSTGEPHRPPAATGTAWGPYTAAVRRWEAVLGRPAPAPTEPGKKGQPRLSPAFVEWMQGLPAGWVTDVPGLARNEQLKALGNGVVPQQAAAALSLLLPHVRSAAA